MNGQPLLLSTVYKTQKSSTFRSKKKIYPLENKNFVLHPVWFVQTPDLSQTPDGKTLETKYQECFVL